MDMLLMMWKIFLRLLGRFLRVINYGHPALCRFAQMNRRLLDVYGTEASKMFPNFWPQYDTRYTTLSPDKILR